MKTVLFLTDDYWHRANTIKPLADILFPEDSWKMIFTTDPADLYAAPDLDLLVSFKAPIENNQIPTPVWSDAAWTECILKKIESGLGFIAVHSALTALDESYTIVKELTHTVFLNHPPQCEVGVHILKEHPVTAGISDFTLPVPDEHYQMKMVNDGSITMLAETVSQHGTQPGLWVSEYGEGRICCFTPGHTTESLTSDGFVWVMKNAIGWCCQNG